MICVFSRIFCGSKLKLHGVKLGKDFLKKEMKMFQKKKGNEKMSEHISSGL